MGIMLGNLEELIKALKICSDADGYCEICPKKKDLFCANHLMSEAADAIEELLAERDEVNADSWKTAFEVERDEHRWIPVTERLPEEDEPVFVARKFLGIKGQVPPSTYTEIAYRIDDNWYADSDEYKIARSKHTDPLFWMPLPEPPESEDE